MLGALLLAFSLVTIVHSELCRPDAQNAFKVRLSIKTALGDNAMNVQYTVIQDYKQYWHFKSWMAGSPIKMYTSSGLAYSCPEKMQECAYAWDANEEYLFKAMVAFAMRRYFNKETTQISNVLLCNMTERVSFWFVVTDSTRNVTTVPGSEVEAAIRMNRNRINSAFLLTDNTLQFLKISSTLSPPIEPTVPVWLVVFGVVLCLVVAGILLLVVSGIQQRKKNNHESAETGDLEDKSDTPVTTENGIPCDILDLKAGQINGVYAADDERLTPL